MALTKDMIQAALKKRGLNEQNANFMTFETEEQMNTALDSFTPKAKTYTTYDDILADENLKSLALQYGDKRVGDAKAKWDKDHPGNTQPKPEDLAGLITTAIEAALKPVTEKVTKLESERLKELRTEKIKNLVSKELPESVHDLVIKAISDDMDDTKISTFIGEQKAKLTEAGLKGIGVPGSGGGAGNTTAKDEISSWGEKKSKKNEKLVETKK